MPVRVVAIGKKTKGGEIPTQRWRDSYIRWRDSYTNPHFDDLKKITFKVSHYQIM
jgi:hypothetical protein